MAMPEQPVPEVIERLFAAWNGHDLEAFLDCFEPGYESRWLLEPGVDFVGRENVRRRWGANFAEMPDFRADLLGLSVHQGEAWVELRWRGTRVDGSRFAYQGVIIYGIVGARIASGRLYMQPLREAAAR
jgi:ketosteroid isomerase-like protein